MTYPPMSVPGYSITVMGVKVTVCVLQITGSFCIQAGQWLLLVRYGKTAELVQVFQLALFVPYVPQILCADSVEVTGTA